MPEYKLSMIVEAQDRASGPLGNAGGALGKLGGIVAGLVAGAGLLSLGKQALSAVADYERLGMALTNLAAREIMAKGKITDMTAALAQAAPRAKELQAWVQKVAIQSPFTSTEVSSALRMGMAYGFGSEQAQRLTQALIDFSAGSGSSGEGMSRIALALGQIQAKGKLAGQEVLQLTEAGLPVTSILTKAFNVTTAELVKMQEKGLIPAGRAIEAITAALERDFGGAAKRQTATWSGLLSTLSDIKQIGLRELTGGVFAAIQPSIAGIVDYLSSEAFMGKLRAAGETGGRWFAQGLKAGAAMESTLTQAGFGAWQAQVQGQLSSLGGPIISVQSLIVGVQNDIAKMRVGFVEAGSMVAAFATFAKTVISSMGADIAVVFANIGDYIGGWMEGLALRGQALQQTMKGDFLGAATSRAGATAAFARSAAGKAAWASADVTASGQVATAWNTMTAAFGAATAERVRFYNAIDAGSVKVEADITLGERLAQGTLANLPDDMRLAQEGMTDFAAATGLAADNAAPLAANLDKAADALADMAKTEFSKAQDQLRNLLPDMNLGGIGENKPGSNGPFENIFRAADVAKLGAASPWAAQLGLTQEAAKQIVTDFAQGFRTPEVRALINESMIIDQAARAQAAADSLTAWGNEIAAKAGVSTALKAGGTAVTAAIFGGGGATGKDSAGPQTTGYATAAKDMLGSFAGALQTQVVDKALDKSLRDVGAQTFGIFEGGVVEAAGKSTALKAVIFAMAQAAWAAQPNATNAARASGVND